MDKPSNSQPNSETTVYKYKEGSNSDIPLRQRLNRAFNVFWPLYMLVAPLPREWKALLCTAFVVLSATSILVNKMKYMYCIIACPLYLVSLSLAFTLHETGSTPYEIAKSGITALLLAALFTILKVSICMSVCLHRYAAHSAFKCGPLTSYFLQILGCLANQNGPIWWASQHRCHHKYCDMPQDPHSPIVTGIEKAFSFFLFHINVHEAFAPRHIDTKIGRFINEYSVVFVSIEMIQWYKYFGRFGLFVGFVSMWACQASTLWFNVINHPPDEEKTKSTSTSIKDKCQSSNHYSTSLGGSYIPFMFLNLIISVTFVFSNENNHDDHHTHASLAKRAKYDFAYWFFIKPLELAGLVYDVNV